VELLEARFALCKQGAAGSGPATSTTISRKDYREVDGRAQGPHTIRQDNPAVSLVTKIRQVTYNVPIDDLKIVKP